MRSAPHATAAEIRTVGTWRDERLYAVVAALMLSLWAGHTMLADNIAAEDTKPAQAEASEAPETGTPVRQGEYVIAGYGGAPYTHPSDVRFEQPGVTDLTVRDVTWQGRPFKAPVYYGIRALQWSGGGTFGGMLDFTHSKAISLRDQEVQLDGTRNGQPLSGRRRLGDVFRHFEFSHGHNTLTLNGMTRLANLLPRVGPYVGLGAGVALPHTEVHFTGDATRTYEYQYVGPAAQAVLGMELRLPHASVFLEYKFTIARYDAPMTGRDGGWFPYDFWRQAVDVWQAATPAAGLLSTTLASHHVAAGVGLRVLRSPVARTR